METFVDAVTSPQAGRGPSRWNERAGVCVGVANLSREASQAIADRVSDVAAMLGMAVGEPGCGPNVMIIATEEASALAAALVERSPNAFRPYYAGAAGSRRRLELFVTTDRPVRWWHVSMPVTVATGAPAVRLPGEEEPRRIRGDGLLTAAVRNEFRRAFVIFDIDQVEGLTLRQLSDYIAMVAFAQIDPDADIGSFPSILNVVANPDIAQEMTDWDRAYLDALYGTELNRRAPASQLGQVANDMFRDRRDAAAAESSTPEDEPD